MNYAAYNPYVPPRLPHTPYGPMFTFDTGFNWRHPGLGDAATQITSQAIGAGATAIAAAGITTGAFLSSIGIASIASGPLAPFVAAAGALVALFGQIFQGCGQSCVLATQDANKVEIILKSNLENYQASGHTYQEQQAALATFDYAWQQLEQGCGSASLAQAGVNCISERQRGGCASWQCNGCTAPGANVTKNSNGQCCGCDWFVLYRDPIANDPNVIGSAANPTGTTITGGSTTTGSTSSGVDMQQLAPLLLAAGILIAVMVVL